MVMGIKGTEEDVLQISWVTTSSGADTGRERRQGKAYKMKLQRYTLRCV